jgi:hypothetical protein
MSVAGEFFLLRRGGALRVAGAPAFLRAEILRERGATFDFDLADRAEVLLFFFMANGVFHVAATSLSGLRAGL